MWRISILLFLYFSGIIFAPANPVGEQVLHGTVDFLRSGSQLQINQSTDQAIIEWGDFSIASGEHTQFIQPSITSAVLNRITGGNASGIYGMLSSNGAVYLVNPNGIVIGPNGVINAASFIGSTLDMSNADFLDGGDMSFFGTSKMEIHNLGSISASGGDVFLLAQSVKNDGIISAPLGTAGLGSGHQFLIRDSEEGRLSVILSGDDFETDGDIINNGTIEAAQAELRAVGGNAFALAIKNTGRIHASGFENRNGRIWLTAARGDIQNSGTLVSALNSTDADAPLVYMQAESGRAEHSGTIEAESGEVAILGNEVIVDGAGIIDVSGESYGGKVNLGGNFQGEGPYQNSTYTYVGPDAQILAKGINGDGGRVILWSDFLTKFFGYINASSEGLSGDGGFVEVSGKDSFVYEGFADVRAENGVIGVLLLDPNDVDITNGGASGTYTAITPAVIAAQLAAANMIIHTSGAAGDNGDIRVTNAVTYTGNNSLTLLAHRNIELNADITLTGNGDLSLVAGWDGTTAISGGPNGADGVQFDVANTFTRATIIGNAGSYGNGGGGITSSGTRTLTTTGGSMLLAGAVNGGGGNLNLVAGTGVGDIINLTSNLTNAATTSMTGEAVTVQDVTTTGNQTYYTNTFTKGTLAGTGTLRLGPALATTSIGVGAGATGTFKPDLTLAAASGFTDMAIGQAAGTHAIDIDAAGVTPNANMILEGSTVNLAGAINMGANNLTITNSGALTGTGLVTSSGTLTLNGTGAVGATGAAAMNTTAATIIFGNTSNIFIDETDAVALQGTLTGNLELTADGQITDSAALTITGTGTFITTGNTSAGNVSIAEAGAFAMGASMIGGNLTITNGAATDSGSIRVGGTVSTTGTATAIFNEFGGTFTTFTDTAGNYNKIVAGQITQGATTVTGHMALTSSTTGVTFNSVMTGADAIVFDDNTNNFGTLVITTDSNTTAVTGQTTGITQTGDFTVTGGASLRSEGTSTGLVTVDRSTNTFGGTVTTIGNNVTLRDSNALDIGASTVSGNFVVTANGNISDSGNIVVTGLTTLDSNSNTISLNSAGNNFNNVTATANAASAITLVDTNALVLNGVTSTGTLNVTTNGALTDTGTTIAPTFTVAAGAANNIQLDDASNDWDTITVTSGNAVTLVDTDGLNMAASTISNNLSVTAGGALTDSGNISVTGNTTINTGANDITLNSAGNTFTGTFTATINAANNLTVTDTTAFDIQSGLSVASLTLNTGNVTQSGAVTVSGATNVTSSGTITLDNAGNNFNTIQTSGTTTSIRDSGALSITSINTTNTTLTLNAGGAVTQTGVINTDNLLLLGTSADYTLTQNNVIDGNVAANVQSMSLNSTSTYDINAISGTTGITSTTGNVVLDTTGAQITATNGITTGGGNVTVNKALSLNAGIAVNTGAGAGTVTFNQNVLGNQTLNITAGTGDVAFNSTVGATTPLSGLTINSATNTDFLNTVAVDTNGLAVTSGTIDFSNTVTTTNGGTVTLSNSGAMTMAAAADFNLDGAFTQNGAGATTTAADITTTNDNITWDTGTVTLSGNVAMNTGAGAGTIRFDNDVGGNFLLTATAGTGDMTFNSTVGSGSTLGGLTIASATNTDFLNTVAVGSSGLSVTTDTLDFSNAVSSSSGGTVTLTNSAAMTIAAAADFNLDGSFTHNGTGTVSTAGDITTSNDDIIWDTVDVTLTGNVDFNTGTGGGVIRFDENVDGGFEMTLNGGTGDITFHKTVGATTKLTGLTVEDGGALKFTGTVDLGTQGLDIRSASFDTDAVVNVGAGNVVIATDKLTLDAALNASGQSVTLLADSATHEINLGSTLDTSGTAVEISDAEFDRITASSFIIGDTSSKKITVSSPISIGAVPISLTSDVGVDVNSAITTSGTYTIAGTSSDNTFNILDVTAGTALTINAGAGDDTFNMGSSNTSLASLAGTITINGGDHDGGDRFNLIDDTNSGSDTYIITKTQVFNLSGTPTINYNTIETFGFSGGAGDDTLDFQGFTFDELIAFLGLPPDTTIAELNILRGIGADGALGLLSFAAIENIILPFGTTPDVEPILRENYPDFYIKFDNNESVGPLIAFNEHPQVNAFTPEQQEQAINTALSNALSQSSALASVEFSDNFNYAFTEEEVFSFEVMSSASSYDFENGETPEAKRLTTP